MRMRDDPLLQQKVREAYECGVKMRSVAAELGISYKTVWDIVHALGIARTRGEVKLGGKNPAWRGSEASYSQLHDRVAAIRGRPSRCEHCGTTTARRYEWANLTGSYADPNDYVRLCTLCHMRMDGHVRNLRQFKQGAD